MARHLVSCHPAVLDLVIRDHPGTWDTGIGGDFAWYEGHSTDLAPHPFVRFALTLNQSVTHDGRASDSLAAFVAAQTNGDREAHVIALRRHGRFVAAAIHTRLTALGISSNLRLPARCGDVDVIPRSPKHSEGERRGSLWFAVSDTRIYFSRASLTTTGAAWPWGLAPECLKGPAISRAGLKLASALALLDRLHIPTHRHEPWLELGAFPGCMTACLVSRDQQVTAVDIAPPPSWMGTHPKIEAIASDVRAFTPQRRHGGLVCDTNGDPTETLMTAVRCAATLSQESPVIHTIKLPRLSDWRQQLAATDAAYATAGVRPIGAKHHTNCKSELVWCGVKTAPAQGQVYLSANEPALPW